MVQNLSNLSIGVHYKIQKEIKLSIFEKIIEHCTQSVQSCIVNRFIQISGKSFGYW